MTMEIDRSYAPAGIGYWLALAAVLLVALFPLLYSI
jgi:hypothetical protein